MLLYSRRNVAVFSTPSFICGYNTARRLAVSCLEVGTCTPKVWEWRRKLGGVLGRRAGLKLRLPVLLYNHVHVMYGAWPRALGMHLERARTQICTARQ